MIVVDTSAWVEFLRGTGSPVNEAVREQLTGEIAVSDVIVMEVLAGTRNELELVRLRALLARAVRLPTTAASYDHAAALYRICRGEGETVRKLVDCLIAAVTIEAKAGLLHMDRDFDALARHTSLRVISPR